MPALDGERCGRTLLNKVEEMQRLAYEEGFTTGEKAGFATGEQKASVLLERLEKIIGEIIAIREELVSSLESQVVHLSMAIARKIIIEEVNTRPEIIVTMVQEALKKLQKMGTITIKINPALYELFTRSNQRLLDIHPDIVFDVNAGVPVTGPLVISDREEVVTDIDSLLSNIMEEMHVENRGARTQSEGKK
jgi:flagellar biosynthesis/type III secretory pathway protein FliH